MSKSPIEKLLGRADSDPGCEGALEVIDLYVDAIRRGEDPSARFSAFVTHIRNCDACREDTEGLLAAMEELERPTES